VPKDGPPEGGSVMRLPWGLIGFESLREATPLPLEGMEPFRWLRFEGDDPGARGFLVVDSRLIQPVFSLDLDADDCSSLGIADGADLQVWIVVSLSAEGVPVANLRGPIVGNRVTGVFRQVIPANAPELPLRHPLLPPPECSC
jgi:flagellar assembly factor FliW